MASKGVFYVVIEGQDYFTKNSGMLTSAEQARNVYDKVVMKATPSVKRKVRIIQMVSV